MPAKKSPGRSVCSNNRLYALAGIICLSACLSGCFGASTPTKGPTSVPGSTGIPGATPGGMPGGASGGTPGDMPGGSTAGIPGSSPGSATGGGVNGSSEGSANTGSPSGSGTSGSGTSTSNGTVSGTGGGATGDNGPLTPSEQVAILDAELESGTGDFDTMILDTQEEQRQQRRGEPGLPPGDHSATNGSATGDSSGVASHTPEVYNVPGGPGSSGGSAPSNTAKFPPPTDIPSGDDDDVVARQLRELAMSEPDPAVRERLWDEYRKYKGLD